MINKILFGLEKFKISNDKIIVVETKFPCATFENLSDKERSKLSEITQLEIIQLFESICYATLGYEYNKVILS